MGDLPLGRIVALMPEFAMKDLPLGRTLMMMILQFYIESNPTSGYFVWFFFIQGVTGPHRKNDRDDRPCREDNFFEGTCTRKHVVYGLCAGEGVRL